MQGLFTLFLTGMLLLFTSIVQAFSEPPIKTALSFEMLKGLPDDANCLNRIIDAFGTLEISNVPWKRIIASLQTGESEITPCIFHSKDRETFLHLHGPIAMLPIVLVQRTPENINLDKKDHFMGVFLRGTYLIKRHNVLNQKMFEVSHIDSIFEIIRRGRADYSLMPANFLDNRNIADLSTSVIEKIPLYIGISKLAPRAPQLLETLKQKVPLIEEH